MVGQRLEREKRDALERAVELVRMAYRHEEHDPVGVKVPPDEAQDVCRFLIEPLRVVDDDEQTSISRRAGKQGQRGQADQKEIRRCVIAKPERGSQRARCRGGRFSMPSRKGRSS